MKYYYMVTLDYYQNYTLGDIDELLTDNTWWDQLMDKQTDK